MILDKPQKTMIICLSFISGVIVFFLNQQISLSIVLLFLLIFLLYKKSISPKLSFVIFSIFLFGIFYSGYKIPKPDKLYDIAPKSIILQGIVSTSPEKMSETKTRFELLTTNPPKAKVLVNIYEKPNTKNKISIGDEIEVSGYLKTPYQATNPGEFDYKKYLRGKGIFTILSVNTYGKSYKHKNEYYKVIDSPKTLKWSLLQKFDKTRNQIIEENKKYLSSPNLEVMEGMVFGDYAVPAPDDIKQDFMKSGLLHLLAASGMNVGFIFGAWFFIASLLRLPYRLKMGVGAVLILIYSAMTGFPPSIVRALIMAEFLILAKFLDRKADNTIVLTMVCALMLLYNPMYVQNISFQLSFLTTFGLLLCTEPLIQKFRPLPETVSAAVLVPFIAQIWAAPVQIFYFNNFSLYSVPANILVVPFTAVVTFLGFTASFFTFVPIIGSPFCRLFDMLANPLVSMIIYVSSYVSNLPHSLYSVATPKIQAIFAFYFFIILITFAVKNNFSVKKLNYSALIAGILLVMFVFQGTFDRSLKITVFDVGQGDAIFIQTPDKKNILVDTGPNGFYSPAKRVLLSYFRHYGIKKIDRLILSHPDSDHIGGAKEILTSIKVDEVLHNGLSSKTKTAKKLKALLISQNIPNKIMNDGDKINIDKNLDLTVIRDAEKTKTHSDKEKNEDCLMLYIDYKSFSALLMADAEADSLYQTEKHVKKPIDIIKIGHHGSRNAVNQEMLDYYKPQIAVISVGKAGYRYGHPNKQVMEELSENNIKTFRTDKDFAIIAKSNGYTYEVKSYKTQKTP